MTKRIRYDKETECWQLYEEKRMLYPLHCGDPLLLRIGDEWIEVGLELDTQWYVKLGNAKFWLHHKTEYTVKPLF